MKNKRRMFASCAVFVAVSLPVVGGPPETSHAPECTGVQGKFSEYVITPSSLTSGFLEALDRLDREESPAAEKAGLDSTLPAPGWVRPAAGRS